MRLSIMNSTSMMTIFLIQMNLLSNMAYSQSQEKMQSSRTGAVPVEAIEWLRAIYDGKEFSVKSFEATLYPDGSGSVTSYTSIPLKKYLTD